MRLILVGGPWGSGSTALAGVLQHLGVQAPGPFFQTFDPRMPNSLEMVAFRDLVLQLADEATQQRRVDPAFSLFALQRFRQQLERDSRIDPSQPILLKLPLAAVLLPELSEVFNLLLPICLRPLEAIEATRLRRRWPAHFGQAGAERLYGQLFSHVVNSTTPTHLVRFETLRRDPAAVVPALAAFCQLQPSSNQLQAAISCIQPAPTNGGP